MIRLEELEQARQEIDKTSGEMPMKQIMFNQNTAVAHVRDGMGDFINLWRIHHSISQKDVL